MTNEELLKEITSLPPDAKQIVEDFIIYVRTKATDGAAKTTKKKRPLREEPFFGMWADREDMADAVEWVRKIRREQWDPSDRWS